MRHVAASLFAAFAMTTLVYSQDVRTATPVGNSATNRHGNYCLPFPNVGTLTVAEKRAHRAHRCQQSFPAVCLAIYCQQYDESDQPAELRQVSRRHGLLVQQLARNQWNAAGRAADRVLERPRSGMEPLG